MFALKNILKKIKRQSVDCDKIFAKHIVHKGFASIIYKELLKLKKTNNPWQAQAAPTGWEGAEPT